MGGIIHFVRSTDLLKGMFHFKCSPSVCCSMELVRNLLFRKMIIKICQFELLFGVCTQHNDLL